MRILVAEDDGTLRDYVCRALEDQGFVVDATGNGDEAHHLATTQAYDAIVLDIMMPGRDGLSTLRQLRQRRSSVPVLLLTARDALDERLEGLNLGADDYITKPFFVEELVARIQAIVRRAGGEGNSLLQAGDLTLNLITREVRRGDRSIELTAREFSLLEYLMQSRGRILGRAQILEHVWGYDFDPESNLVNVYVQRIRKKIDPDGEHGLIETVRRVGYRFRRG